MGRFSYMADDNDYIKGNYQLINKNKSMNSGIFKLNWKDIASAVVSAVVIAILGYLATLTNFYTLSFHQVINIGIAAGVTSLLKSFMTTDSGNFVGTVAIK